jgi:hypothetical protein
MANPNHVIICQTIDIIDVKSIIDFLCSDVFTAGDFGAVAPVLQIENSQMPYSHTVSDHSAVGQWSP